MSIGSFLLTPENLEFVRKTSWKLARPKIVEQGLRYYGEHEDEVDRVRRNLDYMGLPSTDADLDKTLEQVVVHYYEKLFGLVKRFEIVWVIKNRIEVGDSLAPLFEAKAAGKSIFVAESHFGGTYLLPGLLMVNGFETYMVARFPAPVQALFDESVRAAVERYGCAKVTILNVLDENIDIPLKMMTVLMRGGVISNVFDEPNQFSKPVQLLGKELRGGSGMDRILRRFTDEQVLVVSPFVVRTSDETFRLEIDQHSLAKGDLIESLYRSLEKRVRAHPEQWFFVHELHEAMPDNGR